MSSTYPVHEMFDTFQGEGDHMGKAAFFVRLYGCPVQCTFCDSAGTWHPDYIPKGILRLTAEQIVREIADRTYSNIVVVTGGEPAIHKLQELTTELWKCDFRSHLETSGAYEITGLWDWVTLSPKRAAMPLVSNLCRAHEFKVIVEKPEDLEFYIGFLSGKVKDKSIWLHPEWSQRSNPAVLKAISDAVKFNPWRMTLRAGYQLHKLYNVDALDPGSRPLVPLGGNPEKGF